MTDELRKSQLRKAHQVGLSEVGLPDIYRFLGRNIDLGGSFPTHDLKFGQFCDSTKNFGRPKFCWNFSEIFRFFL